MKTRILTFILSIVLGVAARAELKGEQNTIDLHPAIGDKTAVAHFKYQNTGTTPVHFISVKASCGCTTTQSQKELVNSGEKGEIVATFNIGDRTGQQIKTVTVQTDNPNPTQATTILTLKATIPQSLDIKPTFVYWQSGEESKVEQGSSSGEWPIEVIPKDTSRAVQTSLLIQSDYPKEAPKSFYVNVQVTNPPGAPPALKPNVPNAPAVKAATPPAIPKASPSAGVER